VHNFVPHCIRLHGQQNVKITIYRWVFLNVVSIMTGGTVQCKSCFCCSYVVLSCTFYVGNSYLIPVCTYGIELWGCASKSNIAIIQRHQSKLLRSITNAQWYVSNHTLHSDLHIPNVHTVFRERTATHRTALDSHPNPLMEPLVHPPNNRRLKTKKDV